MQEKQLEKEARFFKGFADKSRLLILATLIDEAKTVGDIVKETGLSQPNASMHLACMLNCGIVTRTRNGRHALYALSSPEVEKLILLMQKIVHKHASKTAECVNQLEASA